MNFFLCYVLVITHEIFDLNAKIFSFHLLMNRSAYHHIRYITFIKCQMCLEYKRTKRLRQWNAIIEAKWRKSLHEDLSKCWDQTCSMISLIWRNKNDINSGIDFGQKCFLYLSTAVASILMLTIHTYSVYLWVGQLDNAQQHVTTNGICKGERER